MNRYHIQRGDARTTVTLDSTLCELLALKMGKSPVAKDSRTSWPPYQIRKGQVLRLE
ncbi:MAG: hypothetical protein PHE17_21130 [Thiothrix sp.]|uniref:hypothetical protein n=1 Tax=Thiothrix sp. TaxID=1032 RepID=UPI00260160FD|nr:hypothetical protein [Thiothrix sp.]MDD5395535.1 hypothetical protein [Thiothrix sp.]